ncbi:hypothetical protein M1116_02120 [Patescibacteria group bacterium]|nr:hypothetical protein [Patescibacteria group bacterium]
MSFLRKHLLLWFSLAIWGLAGGGWKLTALALQQVAATVRINVCGDGIVEGSEDCEGNNLNGATCRNQGYGPGTLACDIACSYDFSRCGPRPTPTITPTLTPTRTPTPTLTATPTPTATLIPTVTATVTATLTPIPTNTPTAGSAATTTPVPAATSHPTNTPSKAAPSQAQKLTPMVMPTPTPVLPGVVQFFDENRSGRIEVGEVFAAAKKWFDLWQASLAQEPEKTKGCDLNRDTQCNLIDLSILLYYSGR